MENQTNNLDTGFAEVTQTPVSENINVSDAKTQPRRVRRVGTLTMGVALIVTGLAICAIMFVPNFDVVTLAKLSPILLIALGVEIIIASAKKDASKIKYDFLSVFVCFILICSSIGVSMIPVAFEYFGPARNAVSSNVAREVQTNLELKHDDFKDLYRVSINTNFNQLRKFNGTEGLSAITSSDTMYAYAEFNGDYKTKEEFAAAVLPVYKELSKMSVATLAFTAKNVETNNQNMYEIDMRGVFYKNLDAEHLADLVNESIYREDARQYMSDTEYSNYKIDQIEQQAAENNDEMQWETFTEDGKLYVYSPNGQRFMLVDKIPAEATDGTSTQVNSDVSG